MAKTLLVIDDDRDIREVAKTSLELVGGFTVIVAESGQRGVTAAQEVKPDAIILDLMMPVMDGWAVLEQMQAIPPEDRPRVIVVSARSSLRDRAKAAELGADAFVSKPFNVDDLLAVLHGLSDAPADAVG